MRRDFHRQLELLRADVGTMCELTGRAAGRATTALLDVDAEAAGQVLVEADHRKLLNTAVERRAVSILARQAPVAGDLRATVTAIQIAADAERMGALTAHVARVCLRRDPEPVVPGELRECFRQMGKSRSSWPNAVEQLRWRAIARRPTASATATRRWKTCTGSCSGWCRVRGGRTVPSLRSTSCCLAGSTGGSPTTQGG